MKKIAIVLCAVVCTSITMIGCNNASTKSAGKDANITSTQSNDSVSVSYVESATSKELGTELYSKKFALNEKIYTLGLPVKDLIKDGWQVSDGSNQKIAANSKSEEVKMKNGDFSITVIVSNTTGSEISLEDGVISSITVADSSIESSVYSSNNGSITISPESISGSTSDTSDTEDSTVSVSPDVPEFIIPNDVRVGILSTDVEIALSGYRIEEKDNEDGKKDFYLSKNTEYNIQIVIGKSNRVKAITISM